MNKETRQAICQKCGKPIKGISQAENFSMFHGGCLSVDEMIQLATKPKKKKK